MSLFMLKGKKSLSITSGIMSVYWKSAIVSCAHVLTVSCFRLQVLGAEVLMNCKGIIYTQKSLLFYYATHTDDCLKCAEPDKQFALVQRHIYRLQRMQAFTNSEFVVMVERNL